MAGGVGTNVELADPANSSHNMVIRYHTERLMFALAPVIDTFSCSSYRDGASVRPRAV